MRRCLVLIIVVAACHAAPARTPAPPVSPTLVGFWDSDWENHGNYDRGDSLLFFADGRWIELLRGFELLPAAVCDSADTSGKTLLARGGSWKQGPNDELTLTTAWRLTYSGGQPNNDAEECVVNGGTVERVAVSPETVETLSTKACAENRADAKCIGLLGREWRGQAGDDPLADYLSFCKDSCGVKAFIDRLQ